MVLSNLWSTSWLANVHDVNELDDEKAQLDGESRRDQSAGK